MVHRVLAKNVRVPATGWSSAHECHEEQRTGETGADQSELVDELVAQGPGRVAVEGDCDDVHGGNMGQVDAEGFGSQIVK